MINRFCPVCGNRFRISFSDKLRRVTCSKACRKRLSEQKCPVKICLICKKEFRRKTNESRWDKRKVCSIQCRSELHGRIMIGSTPWNKGLTKEKDARVASYGRKVSIANTNNPKISAIHKGRKFPDEWVEKSIKTRQERGYFKPSTTDLFWYSCLKRAEISFQPQVRFGRFIVDTLIGEHIIVEVDGGWHRTQPEVIERDKRKADYLHRLGYRLLRFSDQEVLRDSQKCIESVRLCLVEEGKMRLKEQAE